MYIPFCLCSFKPPYHEHPQKVRGGGNTAFEAETAMDNDAALHPSLSMTHLPSLTTHGGLVGVAIVTGTRGDKHLETSNIKIQKRPCEEAGVRRIWRKIGGE